MLHHLRHLNPFNYSILKIIFQTCRTHYCSLSPSPCSPGMLLITLRPGAALLLWLLRGLLLASEPQRGHGGHAQQHPPVQRQPQRLSVSRSCQPSTAQTQPHGEREQEL